MKAEINEAKVFYSTTDWMHKRAKIAAIERGIELQQLVGIALEKERAKQKMKR